MQNERNAHGCVASDQNSIHRVCTVSERITVHGSRTVQALHHQKHTHSLGSLGECLFDAAFEEDCPPPGCDNRDSRANVYQRCEADANGTSMNPCGQPTASERGALATTPKASRRWGLHNNEKEQTPKAISRKRLCRSALNTDMLVKVACSAVEKAIRAHHASPGLYSSTASLDSGDTLKVVRADVDDTLKSVRAAPPAFLHSQSTNTPCLRTISSMEPFLSKLRSKRTSRRANGSLSHCPSILFTDRTSVEQSKRASALAMKSRIEESTNLGPRENVHWRARLAKVVESSPYERFIGFLIVSNAMFLGVTVELASNNHSTDESHSLRAIGLSYTIFFFLELLLRIAAMGPKFFRSKEAAWNLFDLIVVCLSAIQSSLDLMLYNQSNGTSLRLLHAFRCLRVLRAARVLRTFRMFRPLRLLLTGILGTLGSCFWALLLLLSIIYLFSIGFTDAATQHLYAAGDGHDGGDTFLYFGSIFRSGDTLFQAICGGVSWGEPLRVLSRFKGTGMFCVTVFYVYIGFTYFAVLNVVTALFCQFAVERSLTDQEVVIDSKRKEIRYVRRELQKLFKELDEVEQSDNSPEGMVTLDELEMFLSYEGVRARFSLLGIEPQDAWNLFKLLDEDAGGMISNEEFISGCMRLRGDAKRIDISLLAYDLEASLMRLDVFMDHVVRRLET